MRTNKGLPLLTLDSFSDVFANPFGADGLLTEDLVESASKCLGVKLLSGDENVLVAECQRLQAMDKLLMQYLIRLTNTVRVLQDISPTLKVCGGFLVGAITMYRLLEAAEKREREEA